MKTSRLVIGILSIIMCLVVGLQSCAVGLANTLTNSNEVSGSAGAILGICLLVAGIIGICVRNSTQKGPYVAAGFYIFGAVIGFANAGTYGDLNVWSTISFAFGLVFIFTNIKMNKKNKDD